MIDMAAAARRTRPDHAVHRRDLGRQPVARRGRQEPGRRCGQLYPRARRARRDHRPGRQRQERAGAAAGPAGAADQRPHHDRRASTSPSCRSRSSAAASAMSARRPYLFTGTLRDNLLLGLRHRPVQPRAYDDEVWPSAAPGRSTRRAAPAISISTSMPTGSTTRAPGSPTPTSCRCASPRCLRGSTSRRTSTASACAAGSIRRQHPELAERLLEARQALAERLVPEDITNLVETYDPDTLQHQRHGRREPAVRHADRPGFRVRRAGRQHLCAAGARQGRADRGSGRGRARGRGDDDRNLRRPAARPRILRAIQLYQRATTCPSSRRSSPRSTAAVPAA